MSRYKDLAAIGLAVMLSFGLVACGGGGGGPGPTEEEEMNGPAIAQQRAAVEKAASTLSTATAGLSEEDVDQADVDAAMMAAVGLDTALTEATDVPDTETAGYASQLTAARSVISGAQARVTAELKAEEDEKARLAQVAKNAVSRKVAEAILAHKTDANAEAAVIDTPAIFVAVATEDAAGNTRFSIGRTSRDVTITLEQDAAAIKATPYTAEVSPSIDDVWSGMAYEHVKGKRMEQAVIYTDIEKAGHKKWLEYFTGVADTVGQSSIFDAPDATGIVEITDTDEVNAEYLSASVLPGKPVPTQDSATRDLAENYKTSGTFFGADGQYSCGVVACKLTREADGTVRVTAGTLTFTPNVPDGKSFAVDIAPTLEVMYVVPDSDYMHFGYWMESTEQSDGSYKHEIKTFSGNDGSDAPAYGADFGMLMGKATYSGAAAGRYVLKSDFDTDATPGVESDGEFVASADLMAQFGNGDGTVALADQWSIMGEILNFMDGDMDLGWTLMLDKADLGAARTNGAIGTPQSSAFSGATTGSAGSRPGDWSGVMHGVTDPAADSGGTAPEGSDHPTSVTGEFNGHFANGHVAGAFGARNDKD